MTAPSERIGVTGSGDRQKSDKDNAARPYFAECMRRDPNRDYQSIFISVFYDLCDVRTNRIEASSLSGARWPRASLPRLRAEEEVDRRERALAQAHNSYDVLIDVKRTDTAQLLSRGPRSTPPADWCISAYQTRQ